MLVDLRLAELSDTLLFAAVVAYVVAMVGYFLELAARVRLGASPRPIGGGATDTLPEALTPASRTALHGRRGGFGAAAGAGAVAFTVLGWTLHNGAMVTRGLAAHRVPWGNMYEFSSMVCLVAVTAYLWLLTRQPVRYLGGFVMLPVVLYLGVAGTVLYAPAAPLVPALNSYWIKIHVVGAMASSGIFMVGFVATLLYLARAAWERKHPDGGRGVRGHLPPAAALDRVAYRVNAFAFPVWTFAVMAGAVWAEAAWGRYWGWDPKETWSFVTWVIYAAYLHARGTARWQGRRAAYVAIAGFASLMITYYAVNIWITGLHSYAGV